MANYEDLPGNIKELAGKCIPKHVEVVQAILSGEFSSNTKAYQSVYPDLTSDVAGANVARMLGIASVFHLHRAMRDEVLMKSIMTRTEAMKRLSDMGSTDIGDIATFGTYEIGEDEKGDPIFQSAWRLKDDADISKEALASISEIKATPQGLMLKQHNQRVAIKQLAEMQGWNAKKEIEISGDYESSFMRELVGGLKK